MSKVIYRAAARLVRSESFLKVLEQLVAVEMERQLRAEAAGENIYISKTTCMQERAERDALIRDCFTGDNIKFLSGKFGLTTQHVYRILKKRNIPA
jgi:Mor family transcriptional regulator